MMRAALFVVAVATPCAAQLEAVSATGVKFTLPSVERAVNAEGVVAVSIPGWAATTEIGAPHVPIMRRAVVVPNEGSWRVEIKNAQVDIIPLQQWGTRFAHFQGRQTVGKPTNLTARISADAYGGLYPGGGVGATLDNVHTWRDVKGTVIEARPIAVDHAKGEVHILRSAEFELVNDDDVEAPPNKVIDPDFFSAYEHVYANWDFHTHRYVAASQAGRVLVVYGSQFEAQAKKYATLVKQRLGQDPVLFEGTSSSSIQNKIQTMYKEDASLTYVTIIGRDVPTKQGSSTGGKECDNCYVMLSGGMSLDVFIGRLSGSSTGDIETQLTKIANYDTHSTAAWTKQAYGTAFNLAGDEYDTMTKIMSNLGDLGFTKHDWVHGSSTSGSALFEQMNQGLGVFSYLGHGQGDAWDTPMMTEDDIDGLTNQKMPFFEIDVSCDNGGFQTYSPCMGEALLTATGGAIATMMHAPEARGTMCKHYMVQASVVLKEGKANKVGSVYFTALQAAQVIDPDDYAVEAYNVFGDPTLQLPFAKAAAATMIV